VIATQIGGYLGPPSTVSRLSSSETMVQRKKISWSISAGRVTAVLLAFEETVDL